jgi:copper chaperone
MSKFCFQTSIKCSNCLRTVTPVLNSILEVEAWSVDLVHPKHLLTIEGDVNANEIIEKLASLGFAATPFQDTNE